MEMLLMILWVITAPVLIWSRFNGPAIVFNIALICNAICGFTLILKNWDFGK